MKNRNKVLIAVIMMCVILFAVFAFSDDKDLQREVVEQITDTVTDIATYEMSDEEIDNLATTEIIEQTEEQEKVVAEEQKVEGEEFKLQKEVAYNGTTEYPNVSLGDYKGLTYYSQIDQRWSGKMYSSTGNSAQTIGTSGCGPTSAAMIVTACKGAITPDQMADLFVKYGYRSDNNGTYLSAFRFVADTFNIEYQETYKLDTAVELLRNNNYLVISVNNGLFTTGGHLMAIMGIDGDMLKIYDPYLYAGKFETATRRGKVTVDGNIVYCSIENFRNYANYNGFYAYKHDGNVTVNNTQTVTTSAYTRYIKANGGLNVRNAPNGTRISGLANGTRVAVYETSGSWSRIGNGQWVSSNYLVSYPSNNSTVGKNQIVAYKKYRTGNYKVNASILNVRYGAGTKYKAKNYRQLTANARSQNSKLGNYYTNGYKRGVVCTVTRISGSWGYTASGWICLDYCTKT